MGSGLSRDGKEAYELLIEKDNGQSSYPKNRDIMQGQIRYVLRRNLNKLRTVGDFNEWKSYLNFIKMCSKNKF